jgi:excisionase family DNA binding protein
MDAPRFAKHDHRLAYSVDEASRLLSISRRHLYDLIAAGTIRSTKLGARRLVSHSELLRLVEARAPRDPKGARR